MGQSGLTVSREGVQPTPSQPKQGGPVDNDFDIEVSTFDHKHDNRPRRRHLKWSMLATALTQHQERHTKDGPLWSPTIYAQGATRSNSGVESITAAVGDFDNGVTYNDVKDHFAKYEHVVHSTYSHKSDHPKFRIILPFTQPVPVALWADVKARIDEHIFGMATDPQTKEPARIYYKPSCPTKGTRFAHHYKGELLDPLLLPPSEPKLAGIMQHPEWQKQDACKVVLGKAALDFVANGAPMGEQRARALSAARNYLSAGYTVERTIEVIWRGLQASPQDQDRGPWTITDATQLVTDLSSKEAPPLESTQPLPPRCEMTRVGLGYVLKYPASGVTVSIDRVRRSGNGIKGDVKIEAHLPLVPFRLSWGQLDLASTSQRDSLVKRVVRRSDGGAGVDWEELIEDFCCKVSMAERAGEPFQTVGNLPQTEDLTWLIQNFAPRGDSMTIYGDGGSGKSMTALAMALSVQTGETFVPGFVPLDSGPVLYLDWEAGPARIDQRVKMLCAGLPIPLVEMRYRRCSGPLCDQIEEVLRFCQSEGVILVVVDSMEMAMAGSKGEDRDPNDPIQRLYTALRLLKCTCILVDHVSKESLRDKKGRRDPIGGVYKRNLARMAFELRRAETNPPGRLDLALYNTKRNDDGALIGQVALSIVFGEGKAHYERTDRPHNDAGALLKNPERIALALQALGPATVSKIAEKTGLSVGVVRTELNDRPQQFEKCGSLDGRSQIWQVTRRRPAEAEEEPLF